MPSKEAAIFCTDKRDLEGLVTSILDGNLSNIKEGKKWYQTIAGETPKEASLNIWKAINAILNNS